MRFALIAGEISGDILGAALIVALRERYPQAHFYGVAGPRMIAVGCEAVASIEALSLMGLVEVLPALPRLFRLRAKLIERFVADKPDVVIGIDAPDFNLGLERRLRQCGLKTVHVVSPSVWAWRQGRVKSIAKSVDLMLCLLPFEPKFYAGHGVRAEYIGHPLADQMDDSVSPTAAREQLGLKLKGPVIAVLPGSRGGELKYLAEPFAKAVALLQAQVPGLRFITPLAKPRLKSVMQSAIAAHAPQAQWTLLDGQSREAMRAADVVLLASGTATLECLLLGRPMVVAYRVSALTGWLMIDLGVLKTPHLSLPNLLCEHEGMDARDQGHAWLASASRATQGAVAEAVVPELVQRGATPQAIAEAVMNLLSNSAARQLQLAQFGAVRAELKRDSARLAADAIAKLLSH